jgi:hypothetical protein
MENWSPLTPPWVLSCMALVHLAFYYKVGHVSHMRCVLSLHGLLAIASVYWLQDYRLLCF